MNTLGAMRAAALVGLTAALLTASPARAAPEARTRVSLDWQRVRDADIQRCGLSRLRAGTLEQLVDDGYAVVDSADSTIRVSVSSVAGGLEISVKSREASREETLPLPDNCDATLVLEAISRIADLVRLVRAESKQPEPAEPRAAAADTRGAPEREVTPEGGAFQLSLDLAAKAANPSEFLLFGAGIGADHRLLTDWQLGGRAELVGNANHGVTLLEASAAFTAGWQPGRAGLGAQLEFAPILHLGSSERLSATELDGAFGAGVKLSAGLLRAQLIGYVRLRRFEHYVDGELAFDTGWAGLILRIGAQLFDS
jgi:hypothetical protein